MESSSEDGSFVWTDASNSSSSEDMVTHTGVGISGGEESENGKTYKKKLHKELFTNKNGKHEHESKVVNKKRKRERDTSDSEHSVTTSKKIKVEPESDLDVSRVHFRLSGDTAINGFDECLLDEKVKKEQEFQLPSDKVIKKKRKKKIENVDIDVKLDPDINRTKIKSPIESDVENDTSRLISDGADHQDEYVTKKKKKKKKSEKKEETSCDIEIDEHQNTVTQQMSISKKNRKKESGQKEKHSFRNKTEDCDKSGDLIMGGTTVDLDISEISKISNVNLTHDESLPSQNNRDRRRLSERIQFEEDNIASRVEHPSIVQGSPATAPAPARARANISSNKLKRFAEKNDKLRACGVREPTEFTIDERDEVWVVTCPSDVDVAAFRGRSVALEGRCKVKLQGAAYEGVAAGAGAGAGGEARAALMLGARVRGVPLAGRLALHRRLPRAPDAALAPPVAGATARQPLPDTKLRHPLLGAHYKKALKLPAAVAERLHDAARAPKRRRQPETPPIPFENHAPAPPKKKAKRKKHDLEAAETWESERAIEESLFHF